MATLENPNKLRASALKRTLVPEGCGKEAPRWDNPGLWDGSLTITTDHMITARWTQTMGWEAPELKPYGNIELDPTANVLHNATDCFEGLKAYRSQTDGSLRLFRPILNCERLLTSAKRITLPEFPPTEMAKLIDALLQQDGPKWLPTPGTYIYIRPMMIGTFPALGMQRPRSALLMIFASFFCVKRDFFQDGMTLLASSENAVRAWPGGFGFVKMASNYGPTLLAHEEAVRRGFQQVLWLFGPERYVTEAGMSNFFVIWKKPDGTGCELVTAPLDDQIVLAGITRRSVMEMAAELFGDKLPIVERKFSIDDLLQAAEEDRLIESFATGTAFFIAPVSHIHSRGKDIYFPVHAKRGGITPKYASDLKKRLQDIMYGAVIHKWSHIVKEAPAALVLSNRTVEENVVP